MHSLLIKPSTIYTTDKVARWCRLQYPDHPRGCPNFGIKKDCPPNATSIDSIVDLTTAFLAVVRFNLELHALKMKHKHPKWSERQCRCLLYWQPKVNRELLIAARETAKTQELDYITLCPEGHGVNVVKTLLKDGNSWYEVKPNHWVSKVALVAKRIV